MKNSDGSSGLFVVVGGVEAQRRMPPSACGSPSPPAGISMRSNGISGSVGIETIGTNRGTSSGSRTTGGGCARSDAVETEERRAPRGSGSSATIGEAGTERKSARGKRRRGTSGRGGTKGTRSVTGVRGTTGTIGVAEEAATEVSCTP